MDAMLRVTEGVVMTEDEGVRGGKEECLVLGEELGGLTGVLVRGWSLARAVDALLWIFCVGGFCL